MPAGGTPQGWFYGRRIAGLWAAALVFVILSGGSTAGQPADTGALGQFARWLDRSVDSLGEGFKDALGEVEQLGDRTRNAVKGAAEDVSESAQSLAALPEVRIISRRVICPPAANGAPDCRRAAQAVCRRHGFKSGKSFETRSEESCSVRALLARRAGQPDTCRTETYILRSICQ